MIAQPLLSDKPLASEKEETRRVFSKGFYEIRELLESRNTARAESRERAKDSAFERGGRAEQSRMLMGFGPDAQALSRELNAADATLLPNLQGKVYRLHQAISGIDPALPWE